MRFLGLSVAAAGLPFIAGGMAETTGRSGEASPWARSSEHEPSIAALEKSPYTTVVEALGSDVDDNNQYFGNSRGDLSLAPVRRGCRRGVGAGARNATHRVAGGRASGSGVALKSRSPSDCRKPAAKWSNHRASRLPGAMGEVTAAIIHELNQPLEAILHNAEAGELMLESGVVPLEEVRQISSRTSAVSIYARPRLSSGCAVFFRKRSLKRGWSTSTS